jgi:hypothetical protein
MPNPADIWIDDVLAALDVLKNAGYQVRDLVSSRPPDLPLADLLRLREALATPSPNSCLRPADEVLAIQTSALTSQAGVVARDLAQLAYDLDRAISQALGQGWTDTRLIWSRDFGKVVFAQVVADHGKPHVYALGLFNSLPPDHALRSAMPPDGLYQTEGGPAFVLGLAFAGSEPGTASAKAWYFKGDCLTLTNLWTSRQKAERDRQRLKDEQDRIYRETAWKESPAGQLAELRKQLAAR